MKELWIGYGGWVALCLSMMFLTGEKHCSASYADCYSLFLPGFLLAALVHLAYGLLFLWFAVSERSRALALFGAALSAIGLFMSAQVHL